MFGSKTLYGIQFFIYILGISLNSLNALRPDHSERILNTENIILVMKDFDEDNTDDLEIIKDFPESFAIDKKLRNFHRFVRAMKVTEKAQPNHGNSPTKSMLPYPDTFFKTVFSQVERRNRQRKRRPSKYEKRRIRQGRRRVREKRALTSSIMNSGCDLERQYEDFVAACQRNNTAYKYTDQGKPEENVYDAISKILEVNDPKNCINITGVGFGAVKCFLRDVKNGEINKQQLISKTSSTLVVWICIYLAIATILWCAKGWCCCCFRCSFCFPNNTIRNIKKYLKENPPGFYRDPQGRVERYHASTREKELYEILTKSVEQY